MKYAFIIGSGAFVVRGKTISYSSEGSWKPLLRINSVSQGAAGDAHLDIDVDIKDIDGKQVTIISNQAVTGSPYKVSVERDSVMISRLDGSVIMHVHQLDYDTAMALEHNIVAELEVNMPLAVIRVTGEFFVDQLHIRAENEKLFINENGYANVALAGENDLKFTSDGVVL